MRAPHQSNTPDEATSSETVKETASPHGSPVLDHDLPTELDAGSAARGGMADHAESATVADTVRGLQSSATEAETAYAAAPARAPRSTESAAQVLAGRYELKRKLGQGRFGEVWQAHDRDFDRDVALKILRPRMCRAGLLEAFELERQIIGRMEHSNIAKVFDGGSLPDGRPFLAMELVRGRTLRDYCEECGLSVRARVELFQQICRAVNHAHERFILHCDLKPSNILVVDDDGAATAKVIDFGIAKVLREGDFSAHSPEAMAELIRGTPIYMSPEQTRGSGELTVRSDVYTLGVILYELLTGATPVAAALGKNPRFAEVVAAIRESDTMLPSVSVSRTTQTARGIEGKKLMPARVAEQLRGDLDVIVMRAMEKEPARRYASAAEVAADLERYLRDEPILARRPGAWYRLRKYARRHRAATAAALVVLAALIASAAVALRSYFAVTDALSRETFARQEAETQRGHAESARDVAQEKEVEAARARDAAVRARGEAEALIGYMLFELREQLEPLGHSRLLGSVAERAERYFTAQPPGTGNASLERNRGIMLYNRGRVLLAQGEVRGALERFQLSSDVFQKMPATGGDDLRRLDLATASYGLGLALRAAGKAEEARTAFAEPLGTVRELHAQGNHKAGGVLAALLEQLGELELLRGQAAQALRLFQEQERVARTVPMPGAEQKRPAVLVAIACEKVGTALQHLGRLAEARAKFEEEIALLRATLTEMPDLLLRRNLAIANEKLGSVLLALKQPEAARRSFQERLSEAELLARFDPARVEFQRDLAVAHQRLAAAALELGRTSEAIHHASEDLRLTEELVAQQARANPPGLDFHGDLAGAHFQLGLALVIGDPAKARTHLLRAAELLGLLDTERKLDERGRSRLELLRTQLRELESALKSKGATR